MLVVIGTDCIGSCKSNYHATTTTSVCLFHVYFDLDVIKLERKYICNSGYSTFVLYFAILYLNY